LCPGLRIGWLVPPPEWNERALELKHASDLQASTLTQTVLERFLMEDDFDLRLRRARRFYRARAARLLRSVRLHLPKWHCAEPEGGFALFLVSDEGGDDLELLEIATRYGVSFDPGRIFRPDNATLPLALRLCYSDASIGELDEGARRLARAWDAYRRQRSGPPMRVARLLQGRRPRAPRRRHDRDAARSSFAAKMKSFSLRPPIAWVQFSTSTLLRATVNTGWCCSASAMRAISLTKRIAEGKSRRRYCRCRRSSRTCHSGAWRRRAAI
jgi:hypothetical protein